MGFVVEALAQCRCINEISVVRHTDAVWTVDVERLCLSICATSGCGVSQMTKAHEARQVRDASAILEDLGGHAVALALVEASSSTTTDNACRILPAMLKQVQGIVYFDRGRLRFTALLSTQLGQSMCMRLRVPVDHCDDATHIEVCVK